MVAEGIFKIRGTDGYNKQIPVPVMLINTGDEDVYVSENYVDKSHPCRERFY